MTILVVEDDPQILALIDRLLTRRNYTVIAAADPDDALIAASEHGGAVDLLLTDIMLADRSGVEFARSLQATLPKLKIVFMTGWPHREPSALRSGIGPVIRKPFAAEALYKIIDEQFAPKD